MRMPILTLLLLSIPGYGQVESILTHARALFSENRPQQAITLLNEHLNDDPGDLDARVLLGLICSWDKRWEDGRQAFSAVLKSDPDYKDAVLGLIDLELWSGNASRARELAQNALVARPDDADYKVALAKVQAELSEARVVSPSSHGNPPPAPDQPTWETGIAESSIFYSDKRSSWHETAVDISRNFTAGWVTATFSHANWFGEGSNLIDLQSYPSIRPGTYGFLDAAYSPDWTLYAHYRFGGEIFQSLPRGFEASGGFRYMRFSDNVMLYTASVGKWFGNYWILGRTFINPDPTIGTSKSFQLSLRRYYTDADHFIGLRFGEGASPFEVQSINDLGVQYSASAAIESLWKFKNQFRLRTTASIARQNRLYIGPLWQYEADCTLYFRY
jgi:YaiO family outer membrane protein